MVTDPVNVLDGEVRVRGGQYGGTRRYHGYSDRLHMADHSLAMSHNAKVMELGRLGLQEVSWYAFETVEETAAEFDRLKAELFTRQWVEWVATTLTAAGIVPAEFGPALLSGDATALLVAADWQDERGNPNAGLLLRSAYYRIGGQPNVTVSAGKGTVAVLNSQVVTKRHPFAAGVGPLRAAVVAVGKSVRIVSVALRHHLETTPPTVTEVWVVEERIFRVGDQAEYDSFNLSYFGPIKAVTAKTVTVEERGFTRLQAPTHRLSVAQFVEKNHDFDLGKAMKWNSEWRD